MKKAALILVFLIVAACFSWYIIDPVNEERWIGHQSDDLQALQPVSAPTGFTQVEDAVTEHTELEKATAATAEAEQTGNSIETPAPDGWTLVWEDEFDVPNIDMEYWTETDRRNNFNGELQYYTPANAYVENGCLLLTAKQMPYDGRDYTSGMVETCGKLEMQYGRIEARISLPVSQGIFPAFWMTTDSGAHELDILEMVGCEPGNIYGVCHYIKNGSHVKRFGMMHIQDPEEFHVYALEWDENEVRWYVDDEEYFCTSEGVPDETLYIILTLAVGGEWPGSPNSTTEFPISMKVDYVRVYELDEEA